MKRISTHLGSATIFAITFVALTFVAADVSAGITEISAFGVTRSVSPGVIPVMPVFVDSTAKTSIMARGTFMDLATRVSTDDSRYSAEIGRRVAGSNSSIEIKVAVAGSTPDGDVATVTIHFAIGEERFNVKVFKTKITSFTLSPARTNNTYKVGDTVSLIVNGEGVDHLNAGGAAGVGVRVAAGAPKAVDGPLSGVTASKATFRFTLQTTGSFSVMKEWFRDPRQPTPVAEALVRGAPARVLITVEAADPTSTSPVRTP